MIAQRCTNIIYLPLFLNEKFKHNNKTLYEPKFLEAGIRQVKDIIYEDIPDFLRNNCIQDSVCELDGLESREKVNKIYERFKASLPSKWVNVIERSCVKKKQQDLPEMYIMKDGEKYNIKSISVKKVYDLLIMDQIKEPASEKIWSRVFEDLDIKKIWSNMDIKYSTIECKK